MVARVNGEPVLLSEVEVVHDLKYLTGPRDSVPSLQRMQEEYGDVLAEILVQRLIAQFLNGAGLAVSDNEVEVAEMVVRSDYPEGAFEQMLIDQYINLDQWREQLRAVLSQEKLIQKVLRPTLTIDYPAVDAYYREHIADFYLAPQVRFLLIQGRDRELVEKVMADSVADSDPETLSMRFDRVEVQSYTLLEDNIPGDWQALLSGLEPNQSTPLLLLGEEGYQALVLMERTDARIIDPVQAYPIVERILLERKLQQAYDVWLEIMLQTADIQVNQQLLMRN